MSFSLTNPTASMRFSDHPFNRKPTNRTMKGEDKEKWNKSIQLFIRYLLSALEKAMAPHSSTLAWKIPWKEEPGGLQSMGSLRVGHDWATSLSLFTFTFHFHPLEKEMATHSSVLAWRIPGTREPGRLPSMRLHRVKHDWSEWAAAECLRVHHEKKRWAGRSTDWNQDCREKYQ